ncbi:benzoate/toluate 1,2-dioxygenase reductase subunit [Paraburkholderia sp. JPY158]|uniref:Benzoate/toluate 1,2-dioxygenase reductase subunit n=1 Tax=Paraburkholderia atlantica TaxID=2654982 RepID=A0A7W8V3Z6_PARAM|nr:FAD-binding oxidoreductase [Paraburkholderia atlantica]MBB5422187.1 benzoate/toluate 1,2-dioxygenase reductase subunit [Paraburkholderia atlantica]
MNQAHQITINFADGVSRTFAADHNENVLDAAIKAEVPVLYQCRAGACASCTCKLEEGQASNIPGASSTLLASEFASGSRLLCVTQAESDATFSVAYGSEVGSSVAQELNAFVNSVERIAANVVKLTLELAEGSWAEFRPGQFFQITVPGLGVLRSYSPSSNAADLPKMEFLIRLLPNGAMSSFLETQIQVDQVLQLKGPYGAFFLREESKRAPHIFVAGGTGLAPMLSMIDTIRKSSARPPMLLNFGCAVPEVLFSLDDIQLRQQWLPKLEARICVDRGAQEGDGLHLGSPVAALKEDDVKDTNSVAYLCGPQPMIDAATTRLIELGMKPENIFAEQFVASN